jgi:hypothetical protein
MILLSVSSHLSWNNGTGQRRSTSSAYWSVMRAWWREPRADHSGLSAAFVQICNRRYAPPAGFGSAHDGRLFLAIRGAFQILPVESLT